MLMGLLIEAASPKRAGDGHVTGHDEPTGQEQVVDAGSGVYDGPLRAE